MAEVGKEVPLVDLVAQVSPNGDPLMSAEGRQYLNNFKVTGEKGKYQISFNGIDLGYFLKEKEHVIVTMNSIGHALILHKSCQARYEHSNTIKKALADCSFVTEEPLLGE